MDLNSLNSLPPKIVGFKGFKYKFLITALIAVILALFYWNHTRHKLLEQFDEIVKGAAQQNLIISYDHASTQGWPWNINLEIYNLNVKKQSLMGWQASIPGQLFIKYNFLRHAKIKFHTVDTTVVTFDIPEFPQIKIGQLQGDISLKNISDDHDIQADNIDFIQDQQSILHAAKLSIKSHAVPVEPNSDIMMTGCKVEANDITGQILFDRIQQLALKFAVKGEMIRGTPAEIIEHWSKSGGAIEVSELSIVANKLNLLSAGSLSVDNNLQPLGVLTAEVSGIEETIDDLTAGQKITPTIAKIYKMGLSVALMATHSANAEQSDDKKTDKDKKSKVLKLSLSLQDGNVCIAGISIYKLPKFDWQGMKPENIKPTQL